MAKKGMTPARKRKLNHQLSHLESRGLVRVSQLEPEIEYLFRHALVQDAVYETLLKSDRKKLHRRVADTLESLYPDRLDELAGLLAHHLAAAGENARAYGYYLRAADRASSAYAHEETIQHIEAALRLPGLTIPIETRLPLLERIGNAHNSLGHVLQAIATFQLAVGQWDNVGTGNAATTIHWLAKVVSCAANAGWHLSDEPHAEVLTASLPNRDRLIALLDSTEGETPSREIVQGYVALAEDASVRDKPPDVAQAERRARRAVEIAERLDDPLALISSLSVLNNLYGLQGLFRERYEVALRQMALLQSPSLSDPRARLEPLIDAATSAMYIGDFRQTLTYAQEYGRLARQLEEVGKLRVALELQTYALFRLDRWDEVLPSLDETLALGKQYAHERLSLPCFTIAVAAAVHFLRGEADAGASRRDEAYQIMTGRDNNEARWDRVQHM